jgi:biopolymer transport protein TolR
MAVEIGNDGDDGLGAPPMSSINVTPLVDVMLVLLIVFMVAAPLMTAGVQVNLPKSTSKPLDSKKKKNLTVSIDKDGKVFVEKDEVDTAQLAAVLNNRTGAEKDTPIIVKADKAINYGRVLEVVGIIGNSGAGKLSLLHEQIPAAK